MASNQRRKKKKKKKKNSTKPTKIVPQAHYSFCRRQGRVHEQQQQQDRPHHGRQHGHRPRRGQDARLPGLRRRPRLPRRRQGQGGPGRRPRHRRPGRLRLLAQRRLSLLDLSSLARQRLQRRSTRPGRPLHVLLNNAGVMALPETQDDATTVSSTSWESTMSATPPRPGGYCLSCWRPRLEKDEAETKTPCGSSRWPRARTSLAASTLPTSNARGATPPGMRTASASSPTSSSPTSWRGGPAIAPGSTRFTSNALHPGVVKTELARYLFGGVPSFLSFFLFAFPSSSSSFAPESSLSFSLPLSLSRPLPQLYETPQTLPPRGPWESSRPSSPAPS